MDAKKWLADTAKETIGVNDFEKAKDAFDRATAASKGVDYSGGLSSDIKNVVGAAPKFTKEIATGVGNAAVGAGKALVNVGMLVVPAGRANKAATAITSKLTPKIKTPNKLSGGRQFAPKPGTGGGGGGTATKTRTKVETAKPEVETAPKSAVKTETAAKPAPSAKVKGKTASRLGTFAAGAAAAGALTGKPKGDGPWTPSAIV
jgi:hypothetical protein